MTTHVLEDKGDCRHYRHRIDRPGPRRREVESFVASTTSTQDSGLFELPPAAVQGPQDQALTSKVVAQGHGPSARYRAPVEMPTLSSCTQNRRKRNSWRKVTA